MPPEPPEHHDPGALLPLSITSDSMPLEHYALRPLRTRRAHTPRSANDQCSPLQGAGGEAQGIYVPHAMCGTLGTVHPHKPHEG